MRGRAAIAAVLLIALLARIGAAAEGDLKRLVAELTGTDYTKRSQALSELRRRLDSRAIPLLVKALPGSDDGAQYYGVMVVEAYPDRVALPALKSLLRGDSPHLKVCAGAALLRKGESGAAPVVIKALRAEVPPATRLSMLYRLYGVRDAGVRAVVRGFVEAGQTPAVIGQALYLLHSLEDKGAMEAARGLLEDPRPGVRAIAAAYLYRCGEEGAAEKLAEVLASGEVPYSEFSRVRTFLTTMRRISRTILDGLTTLLESGSDSNSLRYAIELLASARHLPAIPAMRKLLEHENKTVAKAAFEALAGLSGALNEETLRPLLDSEDPDRRLWAVDALRRMDDLSGLPVALAILRDGEDAQRMEAAKVVSGFRSAAAVDALLAALEDDDSSVRTYAWSGLMTILRSIFPYRALDFASLGFSAQAAPAARKAAVAKLRAWWKANRTRDW